MQIFIKQDYVLEIFSRLRLKTPFPKTDLDYTNTYTLLVAVVLSAQSTDKGVNKALHPLFDVIETPQKMLDFGIDNFKNAIKTIGLYNNKAKNIFALSKILVDQFDGAVPDSRSGLESLPGVGRKSANVILNVAFNQPTIAVDTHVFRVARRLLLSAANTPIAVEMDLLKRVPREFMDNAGHWLVLHGRYVCKAQKPDCLNCCLFDLCTSKDKRILD
ncbi:MAG: Endonuclease III [Holosporales bacterium]